MNHSIAAAKYIKPNYTTYDFVQEIEKMNRTYKRIVMDKPALPVDVYKRLETFKDRVLQNELNEGDLILGHIDDGSLKEIEVLTEIADWLGDIIVYCTSEMFKYGIPPLAVLQIIMASNFSKLGADGEPIIEAETGKFLKGPNYWKPESMIRDLLEQCQRG